MKRRAYYSLLEEVSIERILKDLRVLIALAKRNWARDKKDWNTKYRRYAMKGFLKDDFDTWKEEDDYNPFDFNDKEDRRIEPLHLEKLFTQ